MTHRRKKIANEKKKYVYIDDVDDEQKKKCMHNDEDFKGQKMQMKCKISGN